MLEISILVILCKYVYKTAEAKGYPGALFAVIMVVSWLGGGMTGAVIGMMEQGEDDVLPFGFLIGYLVGVMAAAAINYTVVSSLPGATAAKPNPNYDRQRQRDWEEREYIERRRRGEPEPESREAGEVVVLTPVKAKVAKDTDTPIPVARRAQQGWKRKWNS